MRTAHMAVNQDVQGRSEGGNGAECPIKATPHVAPLRILTTPIHPGVKPCANEPPTASTLPPEQDSTDTPSVIIDVRSIEPAYEGAIGAIHEPLQHGIEGTDGAQDDAACEPERGVDQPGDRYQRTNSLRPEKTVSRPRTSCAQQTRITRPMGRQSQTGSADLDRPHERGRTRSVPPRARLVRRAARCLTPKTAPATPPPPCPANTHPPTVRARFPRG